MAKKQSIEKTKIDFLLLFTYIYLTLPFILFVLTWLKPIYGIVLAAITIFGIYCCLKNETPLWHMNKSKNNYLILALILFIIILWTLTSGVGSSVTQYPDHLYRNGLFRILIDRDWPVHLTYNNTSKALTYYIGFWLPAAFIGKFTSYQFAFLCLQIWMVIGLCLIVYYIYEKHQKIKLWYFIVFVFFGGADWIGYKLIGESFNQLGNRLEWWAYVYNYPGIMTSTFWVYNQCIYAWLIHSMIMRQKNNKNLLFIWSFSLMNCTFPAVGMIPFVIYRALRNVEAKNFVERFINAVKQCFSWQFLSGFTVALLSAIYLFSNIIVSQTMANPDTTNHLISASNTLTATNATVITFDAYKWTTRMYIYTWFVLLEFGLYYIVIYQAENHKTIYWLSLIVLLVTPLITVGYWIDYCMRGSIPALFVMYHLVIDAFEKYFEEKKYHLLTLLVIFSLMSTMTCYDTLVGVMQPMANNFYNGASVSADAFSEQYIFNANHFFGSENSFFFKYLAKESK